MPVGTVTVATPLLLVVAFLPGKPKPTTTTTDNRGSSALSTGNTAPGDNTQTTTADGLATNGASTGDFGSTRGAGGTYGADAAVTFRDAPGDRGTEIHVDLDYSAPGGKLGEVVQKLVGSEPLPKVKDDLRHFKQRVETGEVPRSDGSPEGERVERKLKQRPAQPLDESELEKAGV